MGTRSSSSVKSPGRRQAAGGGGVADLSPQDRRRCPRVPHRATLTIRRILPDGVGVPIGLVLADLSAGGMGALHAQPLHVGDQYQVPLTREADAEPLSLVCTVVRVEKMEEDLYSIGFEFNSSAAAVAEGSRQLSAGNGGGPSSPGGAKAASRRNGSAAASTN